MDEKDCINCRYKSKHAYEGGYKCLGRRNGRFGTFCYCKDVPALDCKRKDIPVNEREESLPDEYFAFLKVYQLRVDKGVTKIGTMNGMISALKELLHFYTVKHLLECDSRDVAEKFTGRTLSHRNAMPRRYKLAIDKFQDYFLRGIEP